MMLALTTTEWGGLGYLALFFFFTGLQCWIGWVALVAVNRRRWRHPEHTRLSGEDPL